MRSVLAFLLLGSLLAFGQAAKVASPESEVRETMARFVTAFDTLDWEQFTGFFADDATMFQPRRFARRAEDKSGLESQFCQVFETIRGSQTKPPYMDIQPRDLRIQMLSSDIAVATFHLDDRPNVLNRRTIVWQKKQKGWKIVHIHASEVPLTAPN
jgi:ketosteroid isomerase-like protein